LAFFNDHEGCRESAAFVEKGSLNFADCADFEGANQAMTLRQCASNAGGFARHIRGESEFGFRREMGAMHAAIRPTTRMRRCAYRFAARRHASSTIEREILVNRQSDRKSWLGVLGGLGWPLVIGLALASLFYVLIMRGPLNTASMHRYFASHPVSYCATAMFFVGLSSLILKLFDVFSQLASQGRIAVDLPDDGEAKPAESSRMLDQLAGLPTALRESYLGNRLRAALEFVERRDSAAGIEDELKYLTDVDAARQHESLALVRIIIWATPMLGFLGTVIGITQALGDLDAELLATDPKTAMQALLAGLYVAFDTTALALSLSILLMFVQFLADRCETHLLGVVDARIEDELLGRFVETAAQEDPQLAALHQVSHTVLVTAQQLVQDQTDHWKQAIQDASQQWSELLQASGQQIRSSIGETLDGSLTRFSAQLADAERETDARMRARWDQWQTALSDNARLLHSQQQELVRQGEVMSEVLKATGEVIKLEQALNSNLGALAGAKNFEDTVMSLSAAIHLLNTRLGDVAAGSARVALEKPESQGRAA
jgi:biopolymer transport protein ExbB/TolQ